MAMFPSSYPLDARAMLSKSKIEALEKDVATLK
jgi:hypothetical protein